MMEVIKTSSIGSSDLNSPLLGEVDGAAGVVCSSTQIGGRNERGAVDIEDAVLGCHVQRQIDIGGTESMDTNSGGSV